MSPFRANQTATAEQLANAFSLEPLWYALSREDRKSMRLSCKDIEACSRTFFRRLLMCAEPKYDVRQVAAFHNKLMNARTIIFAKSKGGRDQYQRAIEEYATCVKQETLARITVVVLYKMRLDASDIGYVAHHFPRARYLDIHMSVAAPSVFTALHSLVLDRIYLRGTDALKVPVQDVAASIAGIKVAAFGDITLTRELLNGLLRGTKDLEELWFGSVETIEDMVPDVSHKKLESLNVCKDIVSKTCNPVLVCSSSPSSEIRVTPAGFMRRLTTKLPSLTSICGVALNAHDPEVLDLLPKIAHKAHLWTVFASIDESNVNIVFRTSPEIKSLIIQVDATASPRSVQFQLKQIVASFDSINRLHVRFTASAHAVAQLSRVMSELASNICASKLTGLYISLSGGADDSVIRDIVTCVAMGATLFTRKLVVIVPNGAAHSAVARANTHLEHMQRPCRLSCWSSSLG